MKQAIEHATLGKIEYEESFWTGKKKLYINGTPLQKQSKGVYLAPDGGSVYLEGNYLTGAFVNINSERIRLTAAVKWYEIVLSILPFILIMVWGNSAALCSIVPVIGGAIGGGISGVMCVTNLFIIKGVKPVWLKLVISIAMLVATFLLCFLIALIYLAAVN